MTVPPEGPYGQSPYGPNSPWSGQPQQGGYPGGYGQPAAPGSGYPPESGYQPGQAYPQYPGQPYPGGQYPGQPQPPAPPEPPRSKLPWVIGGALLLVVAIVVATVVLWPRHNDESTTAESSTSSPTTTSTSAGPTTTQPADTSEQTATDCTENVSAGVAPDETAAAGDLSFPVSAATGWTHAITDDQLPNAIDAVGVAEQVQDAQWIMQAEVAVSNLVPSMSVGDQATKLLTCISQGPGYNQASPTLGEAKSSEITVDGTKAARVDADITVGPGHGVPGDSVVIIVVDTKPATFFFGGTPIGDEANRAVLEQVIAALKVAKS